MARQPWKTGNLYSCDLDCSHTGAVARLYSSILGSSVRVLGLTEVDEGDGDENQHENLPEFDSSAGITW